MGRVFNIGGLNAQPPQSPAHVIKFVLKCRDTRRGLCLYSDAVVEGMKADTYVSNWPPNFVILSSADGHASIARVGFSPAM
jgi:hypothetical protein